MWYLPFPVLYSWKTVANGSEISLASLVDTLAWTSQDSANLNISELSKYLSAFPHLACNSPILESLPLGTWWLLSFFFVLFLYTLEVVEVLNTEISLYHPLLVSLIFDVVLHFSLSSSTSVLQYFFLWICLFFDSCYSFSLQAFWLYHLNTCVKLILNYMSCFQFLCSWFFMSLQEITLFHAVTSSILGWYKIKVQNEIFENFRKKKLY